MLYVDEEQKHQIQGRKYELQITYKTSPEYVRSHIYIQQISQNNKIDMYVYVTFEMIESLSQNNMEELVCLTICAQ